MYQVTEGVESIWRYHISHKDNPHLSLCGKRVMSTSISLDNWGHKVDHIPETYCTRCKMDYDMRKPEQHTTANVRFGWLKAVLTQIAKATSYIRKRCAKGAIL